MEAVGLAVGIVSIAGVFKDVIDLFALFTASRDLGQDYALLETKLDLEKAILLQWAGRVRLLAADYDKRLDEPQLPIGRTLVCIRQLLSDASNLRQRYGLSELPAQELTHASGYAISAQSSATLMDKFVRDFAAFQVRVHEDHKPSVGARLKWVIRDKEKFEGLVAELSYFNTRLRELVPIQLVGMAEYGVKRPNNFEAVDNGSDTDVPNPKRAKRLDGQQADTDSTLPAVTESKQREIEDKILSRIRFRSLHERRMGIAPAHNTTLKWALCPPNGTTRSWDDLSEWLQSGSGIYWVCGKAGSGKSTLMSYLYDHPATRHRLSQWATGEHILVASHFFWNLGTTEQKSLPGLQRSILYQFLRHRPSLIQEALPSMYNTALAGRDRHDLAPPSMPEMQFAFQVLQRPSSLSILGKICLFIDGVDEYDGKHADAIEFIQALAASKGIKAVISSRPISQCVAAFDELPQLHLQDLTRDDISRYVEDIIGSHRYTQKLRRKHSVEVSGILTDLVNKASGVFLWVVLACRSLLSGFADFDRIAELRRLVDELPRELEDMFEKMLATVKGRHREQGGKLLKMHYRIEAARRNATLQAKLTQPIKALDLAFMDDDLLHPLDLNGPVEVEETLEACLELEGRLRSRTGGLLEIKYRDCWCRPKCPSRNGRILCLEGAKPEFMHRTVFEFLDTPGAWDMECLTIRDPSFLVDSALSICHSSWALQSSDPQLILSNMSLGLDWGAIADDAAAAGPPPRTDIFWHLSNQRIWTNQQSTVDRFSRTLSLDIPHSPDTFSSHFAMTLATEYGAVNFMRFNPSLLRRPSPGCGCKPLLYHAIRTPLRRAVLKMSRGLAPESLRRVLACLLSSGCDPNETYTASTSANVYDTPWSDWLGTIVDYCRLPRPDPDFDDRLAFDLKVAGMFLERGADLKARTRSGHSVVSALGCVIRASQSDAVRREFEAIMGQIEGKWDKPRAQEVTSK